ncbi:MAG: glycine radical domain-containing protein [Treponema sp.]
MEQTSLTDKVHGGTAVPVNVHPLPGSTGLKRLTSLIDYYFARGGMQVQFNVVSRDTLLRAQKEPDKYRSLIVRVAGYSAYFVGLDKTVQQDIIDRTEERL